jgi:carbon-monoxide dehydrogenase large subunit
MARELGREPFDLRRQNIVTSAELPYQTAAGMRLDTGDYVAALDTARDMINLTAVRKRQAAGEPDGRVIGVGFAFYTEQSGHGTAEFVKRKFRIIPGYESANARMLPDSSVIIHVGVQSWPGTWTSFAQIAAHERHHPDQISPRHDTATSPYGFGRSRPFDCSPELVARSCESWLKNSQDRRAPVADRLANTRLEGGAVHGPTGKISIAEIAHIATYARATSDRHGAVARATGTYEPSVSGGVFAYGTHAVLVAVDPDNGVVELLDYVVAEDCGTMINPMIVDGQVQGGIAQGIGTALYEEIHYDELGQPLATTFADYMVPCAPEIPDVRPRISCRQRQQPIRRRDSGNGAIAPPAAIADTVSDAFRRVSVQLQETRGTRRVSEAIDRTTRRAL